MMLEKPAFGLCPPDLTANLSSFLLSTLMIVATSLLVLGMIMQEGGSAPHVPDLKYSFSGA